MVSDRPEEFENAVPGIAADPDSVHSVAELGHELRRLRISVGAPTLRALQATATRQSRTLPRSTAGNAESGRHLPSLEVVQAFVLACGASAADLSRWRAAWQRAYASRYTPTINTWHPITRETEEPNQHLAHGPAASAQHLAALPIAVAADQLAAMEPDIAARRLLDMPTAAATIRLKAMPALAANVVLVAMDPSRAAQLLIELGAGAAAELIVQIAEDAAAQRLTVMPAEHAGTIMNAINLDKTHELAAMMEPEATGAVL